MSPGLYQGFNPNADYGLNQPEVSSPQYYELLKKYNTLLKMYRSGPATQQIRQAMPRQSALNYDVQARLPALQQQYPGVLPNLQNMANRLNVQFNPIDLTNTSEYGDTPSIEEEYKQLQREFGMSTSGSKGKRRKSRGRKRTKRAKSQAGGRSNKRSNKRRTKKMGGMFGKSRRKKLEENLAAAQTKVGEAEKNVQAILSWLQPGTGAVDEGGRETTLSEKGQANMIIQHGLAVEMLGAAREAVVTAERAL